MVQSKGRKKRWDTIKNRTVVNKGRPIPSGGALVTESYGFLWWEVNHNKSVSPNLACILDGLLLSVCEHRVVISYETRLNPHCFDQTKLTHEEHGSFESLFSGCFDLTKYLGVGDTLFDSNLRAESGG
jgi:hypothetical protein